MLNMFRTLIPPSSGAYDFPIVSPHWLCVLVSMCVGVSVWLVGVVSVWQTEACYTDTTPTSRVVPQRYRKKSHTNFTALVTQYGGLVARGIMGWIFGRNKILVYFSSVHNDPKRATQPHTLRQCFSICVRPRPGKFFFHKTRARSQQIYS